MWSKRPFTATRLPILTAGSRTPAARTRRNTCARSWLTHAAFSILCRDATQIHQRLSQLLSIGTIGTPQIGGPYYFYTRREGTQNQPVLLVREGMHGKDRALVDANQMSADGTVALDWWFPSDDGKYVAYGTSASGSENSTLHVIETATGKLLPDTIEQTRIAQVAGKKIIPVSITDAIPRKVTCPRATMSTICTFSITPSDPIRRKTR